MKVKVTRVSKKNTKPDGTPLISSVSKKPYWNIGIQVEGSDDWMSGFANSETDPMYQITEGQEYSITVTEKAVGDKVFKNFKLLSQDELKFEDILKRIVALENYCFGAGAMTSAKDAQTKEPELTLEDF